MKSTTWQDATARLATDAALAKRLEGEGPALWELLVVAEIALRVARSPAGERKAEAEIAALMSRLSEEAAELAQWAVTGQPPQRRRKR